MWSAWSVIIPLTDEQIKQWKDIPDKIFWIKLAILFGTTTGLLILTIINI